MTTPLLEAIATVVLAAKREPHTLLDLSSAALSALKQQASDNDGFLDIGDGWVICRNKEPDPLTDEEIAEIERRRFADAVRTVEASADWVVMPATLKGDDGYYAALVSCRPKPEGP